VTRCACGDFIRGDGTVCSACRGTDAHLVARMERAEAKAVELEGYAATAEAHGLPGLARDYRRDAGMLHARANRLGCLLQPLNPT
jgi:hypothetical protein